MGLAQPVVRYVWERLKLHWPAISRALWALSVCWLVTGAALYAWWAYRPSHHLTWPRALALLLLEAALVYAFATMFGGRTVQLAAFPEISLEMSDAQRRDAVVDYCKYAIENYYRVYRYNFQWWRFLLTSSIVLGTTGTVLSSYVSPSRLVVVLRTLTVAATTIATTLNSSYRFQQESVRQGATADALRSELILFSARGKPYDTDDFVATFAANVRSIIAVESQTWVASSQAKPE